MKQTAYHEAAHAVSGLRFNFFVYHVTIVPHENTAGCVNTLDGDHYRFVDGVEELDPDKCRDCIIHALAGYITSVRDCKSFGEMRRARLLAWDDFVGAREVLRSLGQTSLKPYFKLTRDFVRREWTAIEAVANAFAGPQNP